MLAFSLSFETDYLHILDILAAAHVPLLARERDEHHPLVIAGGPAAFLNPEPVANGPWRTDGKGVVIQDSSAGGLGFRAHACPKRSGTP